MEKIYFEECDCDCHKGKTALAKAHIVACCWRCHFCNKNIREDIKREDHWEHCPARQRALGSGPDKTEFFIEQKLNIWINNRNHEA